MGVVYASILWFGGNLVAVGTRSVALNRLQEVLSEEIEISDPHTEATIAYHPEKALICFDHVTFQYTETADPVLENVSFVIPKGKQRRLLVQLALVKVL